MSSWERRYSIPYIPGQTPEERRTFAEIVISREALERDFSSYILTEDPWINQQTGQPIALIRDYSLPNHSVTHDTFLRLVNGAGWQLRGDQNYETTHLYTVSIPFASSLFPRVERRVGRGVPDPRMVRRFVTGSVR